MALTETRIQRAIDAVGRFLRDYRQELLFTELVLLVGAALTFVAGLDVGIAFLIPLAVAHLADTLLKVNARVEAKTDVNLVDHAQVKLERRQQRRQNRQLVRRAKRARKKAYKKHVPRYCANTFTREPHVIPPRSPLGHWTRSDAKTCSKSCRQVISRRNKRDETSVEHVAS